MGALKRSRCGSVEICPIAGIILTFVMCYELIQLIIEKNNLHDFDTWIFFKWIFKTFCAVLIVTNTWNIVMAVFDVAQNVVSQSAGVIISDAGIDISGVVGDLETQLADWSVGALLGLWFQSVFVGLCTQILSICIFLVIYGRMIEVYLVTSISFFGLYTPETRLMLDAYAGFLDRLGRSLMLRLFSFPKECPARGFSGNPVPQRIQCSFGDSVLLDRRINLDVLNELGSRAFGDGAILKKA